MPHRLFMLTVHRAAPALVVIAMLLVAATSARAQVPPAPDAGFGPTILSFSAMVHTTSAAKQATLTNTGTAPLTVAGTELSGTNAASFALPGTGTCQPGTTVAPDASCTVDVTFSPTVEGRQGARLTITDDDPGDPTQDVALFGVGTPGPVASVTPTSLAFTAAVGTTSPGQQVTLTNTGAATLSDIGVSVIGTSFAIAGSDCGASLAPGESCAVTTTFSPTAAGAGQRATLRFASSDPVNPTQDVALSGTGTSVTTSVLTPLTPAQSTATPVARPGSAAATADGDADGVADRRDSCQSYPGNRANGCPTLLNADIRGRWRVNDRISRLISLEVRAPRGSRIELRCSGRAGACGFRRRTIANTVDYATGLTRNFAGSRTFPAGTVISVRVTRPLHRGTYESLETRRGRKLPRVRNRCINQRGEVHPCP